MIITPPPSNLNESSIDHDTLVAEQSHLDSRTMVAEQSHQDSRSMVAEQSHQDSLPDYYRGSIIYYDDSLDDNCRWIVYNGHHKVRCPTKRDAYHYINETTMKTNDTTIRLIQQARGHIINAIRLLDKAASYESGAQRLTLEKLSVSWRPLLVEIDRITQIQLNYEHQEIKQEENTNPT